jgi:hypothetical protein
MKFGSFVSHSQVSVFAICIAALSLIACNKQEATVTPAESKPVTIPLFSAPEDGIITVSMASRYAKARAEMVEVNTRLLDSLGVSAPERKTIFSDALEMAGEKVARRHGLRGLAEYQWIQNQAAALPQNRETLAQAGIVIP